MAKLTEIFRGLYIGIWNFCFPDNERRERQRQLEYVVRKERLEWSSYHCLDRGVADVQSLESPLIVTLTSHGKRLLSVHRVIENLFQQSLLPNKVVLYLGEEEYQSKEQLPIVLQRQIARGLEVRFVRELRSYTKLIPALREFPDALLISIILSTSLSG